MQSDQIIETMVGLRALPCDDLATYRRALDGLVRLRCAELVLAVTLDQLQVHVAMSDAFEKD